MIIAGETEQQHDELLEKVIKRATENGVKFNINKAADLLLRSYIKTDIQKIQYLTVVHSVNIYYLLVIIDLMKLV